MNEILIGSDDGVYHVTGIESSDGAEHTKVLDSGRVMRVRTFESIDGVFAATKTGLYYSTDGEGWTDLAVPEENVYAVGANPAGDSLYAGTRPAAVYAAHVETGDLGSRSLEWREREGFQELPSREEWRLPRHENLAQVKDVHSPTPGRVVAGVEVGGVHISDDGGRTWEERRDGAHDDVHELHAATADEWFVATGRGLYRTTDAGRTWTRLDGSVEQRYFRSVIAVDGIVYASGAMANSSTWEDDDASPGLFRWDGETLAPETPPTEEETVTGFAAAEGKLFAGTHRGTLLVRRSGDWEITGEFPVPGQLTGRYTPMTVLQ